MSSQQQSKQTVPIKPQSKVPTTTTTTIKQVRNKYKIYIEINN